MSSCIATVRSTEIIVCLHAATFCPARWMQCVTYPLLYIIQSAAATAAAAAAELLGDISRSDTQ